LKTKRSDALAAFFVTADSLAFTDDLKLRLNQSVVRNAGRTNYTRVRWSVYPGPAFDTAETGVVAHVIP